jgi:SsrA-binding protein
MAKKPEPDGRKIVCRNRKALHEFFIEDRLEAGLVLLGTEVKSLREGRASLADTYAVIQDGEAYLINMHIPEWPNAAHNNHIPDRRRKLLLQARQIHKLAIQTEQRGYTLVALSVYFNQRNKAKVELGLARGKRKHDKRETIREKDERRAARTADREGGKQP